jgi:hypothetical protein
MADAQINERPVGRAIEAPSSFRIFSAELGQTEAQRGRALALYFRSAS